jgi:hypothetical protein
VTPKQKTGYIFLFFAAIASVAVLIVMGPIIQDEQYHLFADTRTILGIPNFGDVMSNVPFVLVGLLGFVAQGRIRETRFLYLFLYAGITLMAFGSAYYHWHPTTETLFWDRLPMTVTFMSLFAIVISEYISPVIARRLYLPLLIVGLLSVLLWRYGAGHDLRLYAWVQFFPFLAFPLIISLFPSNYTHSGAYWWLFGAYAVAKLFEHFDREVYEMLGFISGHSLKHLAAAMGLYVLVRSYTVRRSSIPASTV